MDERLPEILQAVQKKSSYSSIEPRLIERIAGEELQKGRNFKETVKNTRSRLHQIAGAYQEKTINYAAARNKLEGLHTDLSDKDLKEYCLEILSLHASTRERLPIVENFFRETLASIAPIHSVLDLACGLTPLALPWMPLAEKFEYFACDIYGDQCDYLNYFFRYLGIAGEARVEDLSTPTQFVKKPVQVVFLLKTIACLEHLDKNIGRKLLQNIEAEHVLVSFPARSLGGHAKGMGRYYEKHFYEITEGLNWKIRSFEFLNELAFLLSR